MEPPKEAMDVLPKFPIDANKAYWLAENATPVKLLKKATKHTIEKAVVKLSTMIVQNNNCSFGPT